MNRTVCKSLVSLALSAVALSALGAPMVHAQQPAPPGVQQQRQRLSHRHNGFLAFLNSLNLTNVQKQQIHDILKNQRSQMRALRQDASLSPQQRRAKFLQIRKDIDAAIRKVLTPDQQKKFDEWLKKQAQERRNREHNRDRGQQAPNTENGK